VAREPAQASALAWVPEPVLAWVPERAREPALALAQATAPAQVPGSGRVRALALGQVRAQEQAQVEARAREPAQALVLAAVPERVAVQVPAQVLAQASVPARAAESDAGNADVAANFAWWRPRRFDPSGSSYRLASTSRRLAGPLLRTPSAIRCNRTEEQRLGLSERAACEVSLMSLR